MFRSMIIAFSTYSRIPVPRVEWSEKSMRYSMCFFSLVGAVIGLCSYGCFWGFTQAGFGKIWIAAVLTILPLLLTGGIHMDGFLDTVDAKHSYRSMEEKLQILKDPHVGAFAVIYGMIYSLLVLGCFSEMNQKTMVFVGIGYVYSRILSGLSVVTFRKAKKDGMLAASADAAQKNVKWILTGEGIICAIVLLFLDPLYGGVCVAAGLLAFAYYRYMAYRVFGGTTGDLAGYFLQVCELVILAGMAVTKLLR